MRESIGTTFVLNFIIVFLVFVFAFLAATLSYYKAYKVNNAIIHAIEKFEGYNQLSYTEIKRKLGNLGYQANNIDCPETRFVNGSSDVTGRLVNSEDDGYCIYIYFNENAPKDKNGSKSMTNIYYSLGAVTYMRVEFPIIGRLVKIPVFSKTYNIYYFPEWNPNNVVNTLVSKVSSYH